MTPAAAFAENSRVWNDVIDHLPFLFELAKGNVMEIGVRGGASTSALLAGVEAHGGHLWSVDVNPCKVFDHPQWVFIQADTIAQKKEILYLIPKHLDVLFVDGDHTYEGCLSDLQTYGPRADLILIHDCLCPDTYPGVRKASEEYAASLGVRLVIREGSYGLGIIEAAVNIRKALPIAGWMTARELKWLADQAATHDVVVEVGCYQGRSTRAMGDNAKGVVYAVDDWKGLRTVDKDWWTNSTPAEERESLFERFSSNVNDLLQTGKVQIIKEDHAEIVTKSNVDMVFIDGSHDYNSVKRDIQTWLPKLNTGGLMCGHDFNQEQIIKAVGESLSGAKTAVGLIWEWVKQ